MDVTTLLTDLSSVIHGTQTSKVPNIYGIINRAARAVLLDVDPKETQRIVQLGQVFNNVFDYSCPTDLKGDRWIDLRLTAGRKPFEVFNQGYAENFDSQKSLLTGNKVYVQHNTGVKTIRIEAPTLTAPTTISDTSSILNWVATPGASDITLDNVNYIAGGGAIQFNLDAGSPTGSIGVTGLTSVDLSAHENISYLFYWVYLPDASDVTNLILRWGSDITANYYTYTNTTTQQGTAFQDGWNLIAIPWASATTVGTPVVTTIDSIQLTVTYNSTLQTGVKFCSLTSTLGYIFELQYYSKYIFRDPSTNAFQETVTSSSDDSKLINLDTESYNLLFNKVAFYVAQSLQGADAQYDADYWQTEYDNALKRYRAQNLSETKIKGESYYSLPKKGWNRYTPGAWWR